MAKKKEAERLRSFELAQELEIAATRERVWSALTVEIDRWWRFRQGGDESTIELDPRAGGGLVERWKGGSALWGTVTFVAEGERIRLSGPLGMHTGDTHLYSFDLEEKEDEVTIVKFTQRSVGDLDPEWKGSFEGGWATLLGTYLKTYAEEGTDWRDVEGD